ncbi:acyl-CoA thioester hydrolase [Gillisia sp. Hel_I_86]|uniref:acyl-CoA thioesterase n=1 Tax=Gillisia sp. Hel_I_86 TaxID=1249981 RepID=UPI001199EA93|nr:thioesterase family protein [Gillisia sp. Hel_I_86]TVZ25378.1 acyl-CoA thioester hydrolase [Gillisia sp. Hel_I_86]
MKSHNTYVKVRYAETDQMGVVHHGNYADYLEIARLDWLHKLGVSYRSMEKEGVMLPVYELYFKFIKSALFDDELKIVTKLTKTPSIKIEFNYEIYNQAGELLTIANTVLVFMDTQSRKPIRCPAYILNKLKV